MKMISGSKYFPSQETKKPNKTKGDVHAILEQTVIIGHGSSQYVSNLIYNCVRLCKNTTGFIHPKNLLNNAFMETKTTGSSTACIITFNDRCLYAVNIGDNGFILIRNEEILYESPVQQHTYKIPYQLGNTNDVPEEIKLTEVEAGDMLVAGSAGLFNNLFTHEIKDIVLRERRKDRPPEMIAAEIAKKATERSVDGSRFTPYSKAAWQAGIRHKGGKLSDVTAIFCFVLPG